MATTLARPAATRLRRTPAFWLVGAAILLMMLAASAPSPIYVVYQTRFGFSATLLTVVFAVYAVALLASLLVFGALSDQIGRRPVLAVAFVLEAASMAMFLAADGVPSLIVARVAQGVATGLATGALSAALIDLQPDHPSSLGPLLNSAAPMTGLAVGALGSGLVVEYVPAPTTAVFAALVVAFLGFAVAFWWLPETAPRHMRWRNSLIPRVGIPLSARRAFAGALPALIACWAMGGLYLSLGASLVADVLGSDSHVVGGLVVSLLAGSGALASILLRKLEPPQITLYGTLALATGSTVTLLALAIESLPVFLAGSVVAGTGFGTVFLGALRSLSGVVGPDERGELFSTVYIVSYLAFGIPAVVAGIFTPIVGLRETATGYGLVLIVLALVAAVARPSTTGRPGQPKIRSDQ